MVLSWRGTSCPAPPVPISLPSAFALLLLRPGGLLPGAGVLLLGLPLELLGVCVEGGFPLLAAVCAKPFLPESVPDRGVEAALLVVFEYLLERGYAQTICLGMGLRREAPEECTAE